jgi:hypothetical protein
VERIIERSEMGRFYEYEIVDAPLPLRSLRSRLSVHAHEGHARVDWVSELEPQQARHEQQLTKTFAETYRSGLEALRVRLERGKAA